MPYKLLFTVLLMLSPLAVAKIAAKEITLEDLYKLVKQQQLEIDSLKQELSKQQGTLTETRIIAENTIEAVEEQLVSTAPTSRLSKLSIGGYGEHHYNNFNGSSNEVDAHRYVLYVGHEFNDKLKFFSEVELEHSIAGEGQPGEVELEQAFIDWNFRGSQHLVVGQFLIPVGILNETHEPDTFYGVERNQVESRVIPATWWETGVMLQGDLAEGLSYNVALHSGLQVGNGDGTNRNLRIRSGRQKSAQATADDLAYTARLKYNGISGLEVAATLHYQSDITQGQFDDSADALLVELHGIYQWNQLKIRALYANWTIDNDFFEAADTDQLSGWYVEPSWRFSDSFGAFARWSDYQRPDGSVSILNPINDIPSDNRLFDVGFNYWLNPRVVFKADYQTVVEGSRDESFNLGVGWSF